MTTDVSWPRLITSLMEKKDLSITEASWAFQEIMQGRASDAQVAGFLIALRGKGESIDEIIGFRDSILANATNLSISPDALDIVGTGGDGFKTVNVSTMASIVAASTGIPVIKQGNKAATSASGSSDVLTELGIQISLTPDRVSEVFSEVGITFIFASAFHQGFRHVGGVRKDLGVPTVFNFLGPLCNPARPNASAVGVADLTRVPVITGLFQRRGATALVFRSDDGMDELSTTGHNRVWEVSVGQILEHDIDPADLGLPRAGIEDLTGGSPSYNADVARRTLAGESGAVRDIVLLNAAAGVTTFELSQDPTLSEKPLLSRLAANLSVVAEAIDSGAALAKLDAWAAATQAS